MKKALHILSIACVFFLGLISCDANMIYEENLAIENKIWDKDDIKVFEFEVSDTILPVNLFVNLRTTTDYPYSNIYIFLYSEFPNGEEDKDTLQFMLAESDGKWLGDNTGTIVEFKGLIASGGRFSSSGTYTFKLQHAMREDLLSEIVDVGFRAEKMEAQ